jgi:tripartite-type tricarboxylate transporter receptor subunit TctC
MTAVVSFAFASGNEETQESGTFPSKNISWIVPANAGAPVDIPTRAVIENMDIDTNVIVENISGASNTIGALEASNRKADGYTILTATSSYLILQPLLVDLDYDPTDFKVISLLKPLATYSVVVSPTSELNNADDFMALIQSGERFTYTVSNAGNAAHLAIIDTLQKLSIESGAYIPYNGGAEATAALLNKEVDFAVLDSPAAIKQHQLGDIKVLIVLDDKADPLAPEIPYIAQYGVEGINVYYSVQGIVVHKDTPQDIVDYLTEKINASLQTEAYKKYLIDSGAGEMKIQSGEELEEIFANARVAYSKLLTELGMISK